MKDKSNNKTQQPQQQNKQQQHKQHNRKQRYNKYNQLISIEYILLDENEALKADFKTAKEAIEYKKNNPNTTIYILKTFKLK